MRLQIRENWCAAAAVQNALGLLGVRIGQRRLVRLIGITVDDTEGEGGANECDILFALRELGCEHAVFETYDKHEARSWLIKTCGVFPVILCVDDWDHWAVVAGGVGERLFLFDSDTIPWNTQALGQHSLLPKSILRRWRAARANRTEGGLYYAIVLLSCPDAAHR